MTHPLRCNCGKLTGTLVGVASPQENRTKDINRCVCYCTDCQSFARFLKREDDILD